MRALPFMAVLSGLLFALSVPAFAEDAGKGVITVTPVNRPLPRHPATKEPDTVGSVDTAPNLSCTMPDCDDGLMKSHQYRRR